MNTIEENLWNYIDGTCPPEEQEAISRLIEGDEVYRTRYHKLLALNEEFTNLELDEPPMAFTYNVMEAVRAEAAIVPLKSAINKNVIRGLVGFFVLMIMSLVIYAMFTVNWSAGGNSELYNYKLPQIQMPAIKGALISNAFKAFMFFDIVLVLFLGDSYLRRQRPVKQF